VGLVENGAVAEVKASVLSHVRVAAKSSAPRHILYNIMDGRLWTGMI